VSDLIALRKALADDHNEPESVDKRKKAEDAIARILTAARKDVFPLGNWEKRCLAGAITSLRSGKFEQARSMARRALWPQENRRDSALARFPLRPGMMTVDELGREFVAALAVRRKTPERKSD